MAKRSESSEILSYTAPDMTQELELNQLTEIKSLSQNHKLYKQTVGGKVYFIKAINKSQGNYAKEVTEKTVIEEGTVTKDTVGEDPIVKIYEQLYQQAVRCADERKIKERAAYKCWDNKVFADAQMYIIDNFPHEIGLSKKTEDLYAEYYIKYRTHIKDFPYSWETSENIKSQPPKPDPNILFVMSHEDSQSALLKTTLLNTTINYLTTLSNFEFYEESVF